MGCPTRSYILKAFTVSLLTSWRFARPRRLDVWFIGRRLQVQPYWYWHLPRECVHLALHVRPDAWWSGVSDVLVPISVGRLLQCDLESTNGEYYGLGVAYVHVAWPRWPLLPRCLREISLTHRRRSFAVSVALGARLVMQRRPPVSRACTPPALVVTSSSIYPRFCGKHA